MFQNVLPSVLGNMVLEKSLFLASDSLPVSADCWRFSMAHGVWLYSELFGFFHSAHYSKAALLWHRFSALWKEFSGTHAHSAHPLPGWWTSSGCFYLLATGKTLWWALDMGAHCDSVFNWGWVWSGISGFCCNLWLTLGPVTTPFCKVSIWLYIPSSRARIPSSHDPCQYLLVSIFRIASALLVGSCNPLQWFYFYFSFSLFLRSSYRHTMKYNHNYSCFFSPNPSSPLTISHIPFYNPVSPGSAVSMWGVWGPSVEHVTPPGDHMLWNCQQLLGKRWGLDPQSSWGFWQAQSCSGNHGCCDCTNATVLSCLEDSIAPLSEASPEPWVSWDSLSLLVLILRLMSLGETSGLTCFRLLS